MAQIVISGSASSWSVSKNGKTTKKMVSLTERDFKKSLELFKSFPGSDVWEKQEPDPDNDHYWSIKGYLHLVSS